MLTHSKDFPTDKIWVNRETRQRKHIDISDLIESVRRWGIMQPCLVKADGELIFGERRWTTAKHLQLVSTPVRVVEDLTEEELQVIELEENVKRKALPWQDEAAAVLRIHNLYVAQNPEWTVAATSQQIGWSSDPSHCSFVISVAEAIAEGDTAVAGAETLRAAKTILTRRRQRQQDSALNAISAGEFELEGQGDLFEDEPAADFTLGQDGAIANFGSQPGAPELKPISPPKPKVIESPYKIIHADMSAMLADYTGPKFNMLHLDLPYGVKLNGQANQDSFEGGGYESNPEIYWDLLNTLLRKWPDYMFESSHFMCWISMEFYAPTIQLIEQILGGDHGLDLFVCKTPLIWHKTDNRGIISDAKRRPRNVYEACLFGSTGDRFIVKPGSNVYGAPTAKAQAIHTNEKPIPMLKEFMGQFVDEHSRVLDPTCGSGSAIRASELLRAESAVGWEFNEEFATRAQDRLLRDRNLAALSDKVSS